MEWEKTEGEQRNHRSRALTSSPCRDENANFQVANAKTCHWASGVWATAVKASESSYMVGGTPASPMEPSAGGWLINHGFAGNTASTVKPSKVILGVISSR